MGDVTSHYYRHMYSHTTGVLGLAVVRHGLYNDMSLTPVLCVVITNCDLENVYVTHLLIVITTSGLCDNCLKTCVRRSITATLVSTGVDTCHVLKMIQSRRQTAYLKCLLFNKL